LTGVLWVALAGGCRSSTLAELELLAESPPLHYSVMLTGGAFVAGAEPVAPLARTYPDAGRIDEAFSLGLLRQTLERARVFERVVLDERDATDRRSLASIGESGTLSGWQYGHCTPAAGNRRTHSRRPAFRTADAPQ
jgi:hypothetical protein